MEWCFKWVAFLLGGTLCPHTSIAYADFDQSFECEFAIKIVSHVTVSNRISNLKSIAPRGDTIISPAYSYLANKEG